METFDWVVNTFEENDAGFEFYIKERGLEEYKRHTAETRKKVMGVNSDHELCTVMNEWLLWFRKGHIGVILNMPEAVDSEITGQQSNKFDEDKFKNSLDVKGEKLHPLEGIWSAGKLRFRIEKADTGEGGFDAFLIEMKDIPGYENYRLAHVVENPDGSLDIERWALSGISRQDRGRWMGETYGMISTTGNLWVKEYPVIDFPEKEEKYRERIWASRPMLEQLENDVIYLRIPSFFLDHRDSINELLDINHKLITSTKYFIIDLRNNNGGSDSSHWNLIKYYYTQPIRLMALKYRATEVNANAFGNQQTAGLIREATERYIEPYGEVYDISNLNKTVNPAKIAILVAGNEASAVEQFLYQARQSFKVKIFGRVTAGAYDFSNMNTIDSPDRKYTLWLTTSVNNRYPHYRIDDIGIQPDFYLDPLIKDEDWVDYVMSILKSE